MVDEYLQFQELKEDDILKRFDRLMVRMEQRNRDYSEGEVASDVETAFTE